MSFLNGSFPHGSFLGSQEVPKEDTLDLKFLSLSMDPPDSIPRDKERECQLKPEILLRKYFTQLKY